MDSPAFKQPRTPKPKATSRLRTLSTQGQTRDHSVEVTPIEDLDAPPAVVAPLFHPLYIPAKREVESGEREYGYLGIETEVVLALEDVDRLVTVVSEEIISRGKDLFSIFHSALKCRLTVEIALTTPLLFSTLALDLSANRVRSIIRSFLSSCQRPSAPTGEAFWREDARLAGPHELAMLLRWALARVVRIVDGREVRGILQWDTYVQWKLDEEGTSTLPLGIPPLLITWSSSIPLSAHPLRPLLTIHSTLRPPHPRKTHSPLLSPRRQLRSIRPHPNRVVHPLRPSPLRSRPNITIFRKHLRRLPSLISCYRTSHSRLPTQRPGRIQADSHRNATQATGLDKRLPGHDISLEGSRETSPGLQAHQIGQRTPFRPPVFSRPRRQRRRLGKRGRVVPSSRVEADNVRWP